MPCASAARREVTSGIRDLARRRRQAAATRRTRSCLPWSRDASLGEGRKGWIIQNKKGRHWMRRAEERAGEVMCSPRCGCREREGHPVRPEELLEYAGGHVLELVGCGRNDEGLAAADKARGRYSCVEMRNEGGGGGTERRPRKGRRRKKTEAACPFPRASGGRAGGGDDHPPKGGDDAPRHSLAVAVTWIVAPPIPYPPVPPPLPRLMTPVDACPDGGAAAAPPAAPPETLPELASPGLPAEEDGAA